MIPADNIRYLAKDLAFGEQITGLLCPSCKGGTSYEKSFSLKREVTAIAYMCHRASCGISGVVRASGAAPYTKKYREPKVYTNSLTEVPTAIKDKLANRIFAQDFVRHKIKWAPNYDGGRLAMPIPTRLGTKVGFVFRSLDRNVKPKAVTWLSNVAHPVMAWYECHDRTKNVPLIIVEDQMSAYKASYFCNAVALLGTHLGEDKLQEMLKAKPSKIIVALDEDAVSKCARIVGSLSGIVDDVKFLPLKKDLKDMSLDDVKREVLT